MAVISSLLYLFSVKSPLTCYCQPCSYALYRFTDSFMMSVKQWSFHLQSVFEFHEAINYSTLLQKYFGCSVCPCSALCICWCKTLISEKISYKLSLTHVHLTYRLHILVLLVWVRPTCGAGKTKYEDIRHINHTYKILRPY